MAIAQNIINILLRNYIEYSIVDDEKIKEYLNLNDKHKFNTGYLISEQKTNQYYPNFVKNKNSDKEWFLNSQIKDDELKFLIKEINKILNFNNGDDLLPIIFENNDFFEEKNYEMFIPNQFGGSLDKNVKKDKLKGICFFDNNNPTQLAEIQNRNVKQFIIEKFNDNYHTKLTIDNKEKRPSNGAVIPKKLKESGIKFKIIFFVKYELKQQNEQELINSEQNIHNNNSTSNHVFDWFNKIIYGIPGSGKSYYIKKNIAIANKIKPENQTRIVFYPEYTYSDFIGAIRPITNTKETNDNKIYDFVAGPFIKLLKKAIDNSNENYLFIIEEINRGDAPAIFGEFFQLLDRDDNGVSEYPITNSDLSNYIYNNENKNVYIPKNLFIIATMNTNDQNIFVLDTAFKRRWEFEKYEEECSANDEIKICAHDLTWGNFRKTVNEKIVSIQDKNDSFGDYRIGTYFLKETEIKNAEKFKYKIFDYLFNDVKKFDKELLFGELKNLDEIFKEFKKWQDDIEKDFFDIFPKLKK